MRGLHRVASRRAAAYLGDLNRAVGLCERTERSPRFDGLQLLGVANQHDLRACVTRCRQHPLHLARPGQARLVDD